MSHQFKKLHVTNISQGHAGLAGKGGQWPKVQLAPGQSHVFDGPQALAYEPAAKVLQAAGLITINDPDAPQNAKKHAPAQAAAKTPHDLEAELQKQEAAAASDLSGAQDAPPSDDAAAESEESSADEDGHEDDESSDEVEESHDESTAQAGAHHNKKPAKKKAKTK